MKQELARLREDVETIQKAMGMAPSFQGDWVQWMKRDNWSNLWWCLPGMIILISALLPLDHAVKFAGLLPDQWTGILTAIALCGVAAVLSRRATRDDGRPESLIRETKRAYGLTAHGSWVGLAIGVQIVFFGVWAQQHRMAYETFSTGMFLVCGSTCLVAAIAANAPILAGYAIPLILYSLGLPLAGDNDMVKRVFLGTMFLAVAVCFSVIQVWQIRKIQHAQPAH